MSPATNAPHPGGGQLRSKVQRDGGFTLDARTAATVDAGLAVCAEPALGLEFDWDRWQDDLVRAWLDDRRRWIVEAATNPLHLGGWLDGGGCVHLDVVRVFPGERLGDARALARRHGQRAIFDLTRRVLISLEGR